VHKNDSTHWYSTGAVASLKVLEDVKVLDGALARAVGGDGAFPLCVSTERKEHKNLNKSQASVLYNIDHVVADFKKKDVITSKSEVHRI